ncbi:MAG: hypothetical protein JO309_09460 [Pseudonocardiales bacterium]|nr:hypothetical protein [Pseudonocardiales bacterium]
MSRSFRPTSNNSASNPDPPSRTEAGSFRANPTLRLRPVDEWNCLLVYTPEAPAIHYLSPLAWVVFELCDGSPRADIQETYLRLNAGK